MLAGIFNYNDFTYGLKAYDYGDSISLYISAPITKARQLADEGILFEDGNITQATWDELYVSIGAGNITVDSASDKGSDGKVIKSSLNKDLFIRLGSIIRGMKSGCNRSRMDMQGDLFQSDFNPMKRIRYNFNSTNYSVLEVEVLREVNYVGEDGTTLTLEEDGSYNEKLWHNESCIKQKFKLGLSEFIDTVKSSDSWDFDDDKVFSLQEIIEQNPDKSYVWLKERKYYIVKDLEDVEKICKLIWKHQGIVAFDTETTGLKINITSRVGLADRLVGMIFSITPGIAYYFPIAHKKVKNICNEGNEAYIIEKYFKPLLEKKDILCHNGAYDWKVMYNYGICMNLKHDTYILFHVTMWNDHRNLGLGLKNLTKVFLNRDSFELRDFVSGKFGDTVQFWDLEEESVKYYACPDTDNLLELYDWCCQQDLLGKYDARKIYEIEVLFSIVIAYQEYYGHCVDIDKIDDLVADIKRDKEETYKAMVEYIGHDFNPKSSKDMPKICFDELHLPVVELTDAGNPSTGKDTRKAWLKMSSVSEENKTFIKNLGKFLDAKTLESNFTNNIGKFATADGLMFSEVRQFLETGRLSTSNPNYQGYSDIVKKYIVPRTGYYSMDADYSTVEARIMVSMAGCKAMVEKLKNPDTDYHRQKASDMFSIAYELVTDALRQMSKGVNFGILYGLGDPNLGVNLYGKKTAENTRKAKHQKKLYFKGMEELEGFIAISKEQGITNHFSTTFFKRRRYYDSRKTLKSTIERQSCNARIQGTAADLYKLAMVRLFIAIKNAGLLGKVLISAFVHDECFVEVHKSLDPMKTLKMLKDAMMIEIDGWCPLFIGAGFGRTWYEAKHTEIPVQVQEFLVNTYGENGLDWWNGDTDKLCKYVVDTIMNYKRDRVINYIKNKDNWGKVFKPTENELAHSLMGDILDGQEVEGCIDNHPNVNDDMVENLKEFCRIFDCLDAFYKADIQKPAQSVNTIDDTKDEDLIEEEDIDPHELVLARLNMLGVFTSKNSSGSKLYFKYSDTNKVLMSLVHNTLVKEQGDVEVIAVKDDGVEYTTGIKTSVKAYPKLVQLYASNRNLTKSRGK